MSDLDIWQQLNKRQQTYLKAVYETDQAIEASVKMDAARGRWTRIPASEWRWMPYNAANAWLLSKIKDAGYVDQGTGSTFEALERRELILCKYKADVLGLSILYVQLTKLGRKVVRKALGLHAPKALPVGTLREWHWRALCRAYARGDEGIAYDEDTGDGFGYVSWNTILRLRDYTVKGKERSLVENKRFPGTSPSLVAGYAFTHTLSRLCITDYGKQYYQENWQRYKEMYPDVDAPEPQREEPQLDL